MPTHRDVHYSLLFIFLGVIAAIGGLIAKTGLTSESIWFLVIGAVGWVINRIQNNTGLTQLFDIVVGVILAIAALVGILIQFNVLKVSTLPHTLTNGNLLLAGLDIHFFQSLVYGYFGLTSIRHGFEPAKSK